MYAKPGEYKKISEKSLNYKILWVISLVDLAV